MKSNLRIVSFRYFFAALTGSLILMAAAGAQQPAPAAPKPAPKLSPKQQITGFYSSCKNGEGGVGLRDMLSTNPVVKPDDVDRVARAFEQLLAQMGKFLDFDILREKQISDRTVIIRCAAHFERQPFMNEFTFYDAGGGWRLVHLRYDANLATMFAQEMSESAGEEN